MYRRMEKAVTSVVIATGISSVVTQLLLIRECLSQFQGNEFIISLILFNWLALGGLGTLLARFAGKRHRPRIEPCVDNLGDPMHGPVTSRARQRELVDVWLVRIEVARQCSSL